MGFSKDPKTKTWTYMGRFRGRYYGGRGYPTKASARAAREKRLKQLKAALEKPAPRFTGFNYVASLYLDVAERKFARKTYLYKAYVYRSFLKFLNRFYGEVDFVQITSHHITRYLLTRGSNYNYNVHRKDLSALFTFARDVLKIIDRSPINKTDVPLMPHDPVKKRIPTKEEVIRILMAASRSQQAFILAIMLTQARVDEIQRLRWDDVNFEARTVTKWTKKRKGGVYASVTVFMGDDLYKILYWLWQNRSQNELVFLNEKTGSKFNNRRRMIKGLCKKAGVEPPITYHHLRHFIASYLKDVKKMDSRVIQKLLGHTELRTTEIYLHDLSEGQRVAAEALDGEFSLDQMLKLPEK